MVKVWITVAGVLVEIADSAFFGWIYDWTRGPHSVALVAPALTTAIAVAISAYAVTAYVLIFKD